MAGAGEIGSITFDYILAHEYFHQLQEELSGSQGNGPFPLWFWEGGANFFSFIAYSSTHNERFYEQWINSFYASQYADQKDNCIKVNVFSMTNSESSSNRVCGYSKGSLIVEHLVSKIGVEGYIKLIQELGAAPGAGFSEVFNRVTGLRLEDFYTETEMFLITRGWG